MSFSFNSSSRPQSLVAGFFYRSVDVLRTSLIAIACVAQCSAGWLQPAFVAGREASAPTVVLVGGLKGPDASSRAVEQAVRTFEKRPQGQRAFNLYGVSIANPDSTALVFPPTGTAYRENGQPHFIWRWLGLHAPDLVIVSGNDDFGLAAALAHNPIAGVGAIPAIRASSKDLLRSIPKEIAISDAHREKDRRLSRTPHQLAEELSQFYGHDFNPPIYIPAMSLIGRLRLGQQDNVAAIVAPYIDGSKDSLAKATSSHLAGHLIFAELAARTGDRRYEDRVRAAADLAAKETGDMSDAIFMECPILASVGRFDVALEHLRFMQKICLRPDGLYRHSALNDAAWGRGNAFPALGMSWTLINLPDPDVVHSFQNLMAVLAKYQDRDGMWHEIIDRPDSYAEFSATAMIATAMLRGVSHGWLDRSYADRAQAAWRGILMRIGPDGALVDVCESTGKQKSLEDYLKRAASFGKDARGGGMALLLATEMPGF